MRETETDGRQGRSKLSQWRKRRQAERANERLSALKGPAVNQEIFSDRSRFFELSSAKQSRGSVGVAAGFCCKFNQGASFLSFIIYLSVSRSVCVDLPSAVFVAKEARSHVRSR